MSDTTLLVTVLGSEEWLHFESSEHLQPAVRVTFTATSAPDPPDAAPPEPVTWSEQLAAEPVAGPVADGAAATMRIRWVVAFAPQATAPPRFELTYKVEGVGQSSRSPAFAVERERLLVDSIGVATIPALTNIMLHEFARPAADPPGPDTRPEFDPGPAQSYIRGLSPQQQKFLLRYDVGRFGGNRLVVFITLDTGTGRRMCADYCEDAPTRVSANSSFAVFHCRGPGKGATLVCFTAHFLVNTHNPSTASLLRAHDGDRGPNQWMAKDTDRPVMFKIGCCAPSAASHGVLYNRILRPNGQDVMPGNTLHGVINTVGCWMLFRNYNWPSDIADRLCDLYTDVWRINGHRPSPRLLAALKGLGYDFAGDPLNASSYDKFWWYDLNAAFFWFFRDLVGVACVGSNFPVNDFNVDRQSRQNRFPLARAPAALSKANPAGNVYVDYDVGSRHKVEPTFQPTDALLRDNVLGFRTCTEFAPWSLREPVPSRRVDACTWADLYLFRETSGAPR